MKTKINNSLLKPGMKAGNILLIAFLRNHLPISYYYEIFDDYLVIKCGLHKPLIALETITKIDRIREVKLLMPGENELTIIFDFQVLDKTFIKTKNEKS